MYSGEILDFVCHPDGSREDADGVIAGCDLYGNCLSAFGANLTPGADELARDWLVHCRAFVPEYFWFKRRGSFRGAWWPLLQALSVAFQLNSVRKGSAVEEAVIELSKKFPGSTRRQSHFFVGWRPAVWGRL